MAQVTGWKYGHSAALKMDFAIKGNTLMTQDKVLYTKEEADLLRDAEGVDLTIHLIKKVFRGKIFGFIKEIK